MWNGQMTWPTFSALQGFWPSLQVLWGDLAGAEATVHKFYSLWQQYGLLPERLRLDQGTVETPGYYLRPELIESLVYLKDSTNDPKFEAIGRDLLSSLEASTWAPCGYTSVSDVRTHVQLDEMPSYFLAETLKYLY